MTSETQKVLDEKKWFDSIRYGKDMCGEYDYCCKCKKDEENPCENAKNRFTRLSKINRTKAKAKFNKDGKEMIFRSTVLDK